MKYFVDRDKSFKIFKYKSLLISDCFLNSDGCNKVVNYKQNRKLTLFYEYKHVKYRVISLHNLIGLFCRNQTPYGKGY